MNRVELIYAKFKKLIESQGFSSLPQELKTRLMNLDRSCAYYLKTRTREALTLAQEDCRLAQSSWIEYIKTPEFLRKSIKEEFDW